MIGECFYLCVNLLIVDVFISVNGICLLCLIYIFKIVFVLFILFFIRLCVFLFFI